MKTIALHCEVTSEVMSEIAADYFPGVVFKEFPAEIPADNA